MSGICCSLVALVPAVFTPQDLRRAGPTVAEAPAVFALTQQLTTEDAEIVDER